MAQLDLWGDVSKRSHTKADATRNRLSGRDEASARRSERPLTKKMRARAPDAGGWTLEPHVCRQCFSRLVSKPAQNPTSGRRWMCVNCGAEALGRSSDVLCSCGLKLRNHGPGPRLVDAGLRCQPNPDPRPEFPSLFVAAQPPT